MRLRTSFVIGGLGLLSLTAASPAARAEAPPAGDKAEAPPPTDKKPEAPPAQAHAEPGIAAPGAEGNFLRAVHGQVHRRWADNFLRLAETLPARDPLNDRDRAAEADVVISADGQSVTTKMIKPSGLAGFDDAIGDVLRDSLPFPAPAVELLSDDDTVHLHWTFARDDRRCGIVTLERVHDPLEIAAPKLLRKKREAELWSRAAEAVAAGAPADSAVNAIARAWMPAQLAAGQPTVRTARALAESGDMAAVKWLQAAVTQPATAEEAGEALSAAKVHVCPLVKRLLESPNLPDQERAARALKSAGDADCAAGLVALLQNSKARADARAAAAVALGPIADDAGRKALGAAAKDDPSPAVRGAAMLAGIRPGAGRGKVVAMVPFLRDSAPDVRAAAAAGIVRAGGDTDLDDLYVLFKDDDPRAAELVARELDRVRTEEATKFLVRLLRRPHRSVQMRAAEMLVKRGAVSSYPALKPFLEPGADPVLRMRALVAADAAALASLAGLTTATPNPAGGPAADAALGIAVYRAYLGRRERELAAAWWVAHAAALSPAQRTDTLLDWIDARDPGAAVARESPHGK
ncbi:MAG TPA: HEAT repeat domain-containing protein [Polyangia bacterium]|nr:HEAT repeat domain-containing protein [Polyangia bacterium]